MHVPSYHYKMKGKSNSKHFCLWLYLITFLLFMFQGTRFPMAGDNMLHMTLFMICCQCTNGNMNMLLFLFKEGNMNAWQSQTSNAFCCKKRSFYFVNVIVFALKGVRPIKNWWRVGPGLNTFPCFSVRISYKCLTPPSSFTITIN